MRRREFIALIVNTTAMWPLAAHGQQAMPLIGFLNTASSDASSTAPRITAAFRRGLSESGYIEGRNAAVEYRWAEGHYDRLPALVAELLSHRVAVIAATGGPAAALAAKAATQTTPIVFLIGANPVELGLVTNFGRPDGNVTGISFLTATLGPKRLELVRELVPKSKTIALIMNPNNPTNRKELTDVQAASAALAQNLLVLEIAGQPDIEPAFAMIAEKHADALLVSADSVLTDQRAQIVKLAARFAIPAIYSVREFADAGGLMTYGTSLTDAYRQVGVYTGQILKGAKPGDLPVIQPTKFELVVNLKTARDLGLEVSPKLLVGADEVIE
jgi:putative tryptophan/tyrosine transport system substrate-binding protein